MLVELLIGLAIVGIVGFGVVASVYQLTTASRQANDQQYVITQLRTAELWISRDAMMALQISESGFPMTFAWDIVDGTPQKVVHYYLDAAPSGSKLRREDIVLGTTSTLIVAEGIDPGESSCLFTPNTLTVTLTASRRGHIETCTFEVQPRATNVQVLT